MPNCAHFSRGLAILYLASHTFTSLVDALCNLTKCSILQTLTLSSFVLLECKNMERTTPKAERSLAGHVGRDAALHGGPPARDGAGRAGAGPHLAEAFFSRKMPSHPFLCHQLLGQSKGQQSEYLADEQSLLSLSGHLLPTTRMQAHCASSQEIPQTPAVITAWHHWFMGKTKVPKYMPKHTWQSVISLFGVRGKGVQPDSDWKRLAAVQHYYPNFPKNNKKEAYLLPVFQEPDWISNGCCLP